MELKPAHYTEKQIFNAETSHLWTIMNDSRSFRLKGYGRQGRNAAEILDDHINRFLALVQSLGQDMKESK